MAPPPNNPYKLPLFAVMIVVVPILVVVYALAGRWVYAAIGIVGIMASGSAIRAIRRGRNPWWIRAPVDYTSAARRRREQPGNHPSAPDAE
jgi:hypothetical protein